MNHGVLAHEKLINSPLQEGACTVVPSGVGSIFFSNEAKGT